MKMHRIHYIALLILLLGFFSCGRVLVEQDIPDPVESLPEGVPVTLVIPFDSSESIEVNVSTKAESSAVDETSIHDVYVMIFNNGDTSSGSAKKIYGRFFSYDHLKGSLAALDADDNECWYVANKTLDDAVSATTGAVKVSTITCADAKLVVIANVTTAIVNLDGMDPLDRLRAIQQYNDLKGIEVRLEQDVVNRKDLFLMTAEKNVNTTEMSWGTVAEGYNPSYRLTLTPVDAKVKFRVKVDPVNISAVTPVYWQVCNTPDRCYLYTEDYGRTTPDEISYFESQQYYFEGKEEVAGETWYTFCFYMLENNQNPNGVATSYFQRELRDKIDSGEPGYKGPTGPDSESFSDHYVTSGDWRYAPTFGTFVRFDLVLTLTTAGITNIGESDPDITIGHALTSDAIFTVHLGEFVSSAETGSSPLNNYVTKRGHSYTYDITVHNTKSIYTEVRFDDEVQAGQEGFLLLTDTEIINADCHYEYHEVEFEYRPDMKQEKFSWYVKTPFGEGGPDLIRDGSNKVVGYDPKNLDYLWVMFGINKFVPEEYKEANPSSPYYPDSPAWLDRETGSYVCPYTTKRHKYPGDGHYDPNWKPGTKVDAEVPCDGDPNRDVPDLMDISQLILYVFSETQKYTNGEASAFVADDDGASTVPVIRATAFIDEYYYEKDPTDPAASADPDLWRKFVNASPRELHILSSAQSSRDKQSDVILSSHSVIQQSIQTIYNIYSADLRSLWGTEHQDEMRAKSAGWPYWPYALDPTGAGGRVGNFNENSMDTRTNGKENGRLNTAFIWDLYSSPNAGGGSENTTKEWRTYVNYEVNNNTPELLETYHGMAWSCLTRNRDNDGDGVIDRDEMRWYLAASNQLAGMWIGNESLSINARLYQPAESQWRAHVISSSGRRVSWTEEGGGATPYTNEYQPGSKETWNTQADASLGESVRCLRNIGTYDDGGVTRDMTDAPYDQEPQHYFTLSEVYDADHPGDKAYMRYEFHFDHLNPKSLRELSEGELPYHDQFNVNNCVYLKMETQSRKDEEDIEPITLRVDTDENGVDETYTVESNHTYYIKYEKVNPIVTKLGYNPFCPPGYRFPNHSEQLLMSLYLPNDEYHRRDPAGAKYLKGDGKELTVYSPCRTYYDRGMYGKNTTGFEYDYRGLAKVTTEEQKKVGWGWSNKLHCAQKTDYMTVSRCVRDISMTGTIEGGLLVAEELYPGDAVPLSFSFYSSGASFISASLKLCYTDGSGVYHERDIPVQKAPTGLQYLADQTVTIPTLTSLGLTEDDLDANDGALRHATKFKTTIRNAYASQTFEQPFTLGNPLSGTFTLVGGHELIPGEDREVSINVSSRANNCHLASATLKLKYKNAVNNDAENTLVIPAVAAQSLAYVHSNQSITIPATGKGAGQLDLLDIDLPKEATLELVVTDNGGSSLSIPITEADYRHLQLGEDVTPPFGGFRIKATVADTRVTFNSNYRSYLYYSTDGGEHWNVPTSSAIVLSNVGDEIWVLGRKDNYKNAREENNDYGSPYGNPLFQTQDGDHLVYIGGNIMSLLCRPAAEDYTHPENWTFGTTLPEDAFNGTFSKGKTTPIDYINIDPGDPLLLPATTLAARCYKSMFRCCTSLTVGPDLPATTLVEKCYASMFRACPNITSLRCYFTTYNGAGVDNKNNYSRSALEGFLDKWFYENSPYTNTKTGTLYCHPDMITYFEHAKYGNSSWYDNHQIATIPANWTATEWTPAP